MQAKWPANTGLIFFLKFFQGYILNWWRCFRKVKFFFFQIFCEFSILIFFPMSFGKKVHENSLLQEILSFDKHSAAKLRHLTILKQCFLSEKTFWSHRERSENPSFWEMFIFDSFVRQICTDRVVKIFNAEPHLWSSFCGTPGRYQLIKEPNKNVGFERWDRVFFCPKV